MPRSNFDASTPPDGEAGASEVIGAVLVFAILAIVLIGSMLALRSIQGDAERTTARAQADQVAVEVAAAVSRAAAAQEAGADAAHTILDLPRDFGAHGYTVALDGATQTVIVRVAGLGIEAHQPLIGAGATGVCDSAVSGGALRVELGAASPCGGTKIFLESLT
jgi:hypothetical protein